MAEKRVSAETFCQELSQSVDNPKISDKGFRAYVRIFLPQVIFEPLIKVEMDGGDLDEEAK